jgi:hypothetical protein
MAFKRLSKSEAHNISRCPPEKQIGWDNLKWTYVNLLFHLKENGRPTICGDKVDRIQAIRGRAFSG